MRRTSTGRPKAKKWGLALSGGGFRASFFHIGVLARLADMGILRRIEVISTVSGGSIIGALYYLHVKRLLESNKDSEITDDLYIEIVKNIEVDFLRAVQKNIRMRTLASFLKNFKMALRNYSRSDHIGELYDELIYRPVHGLNRMIQMRELKINPIGYSDFRIKRDNPRRKAKVPVIMINSTTLNNGRNWRFEASRMGEEKVLSEAMDLDKNVILQSPESYDEICKKQQDFELGLAVAASAGVPAIFPPLAISGLYPGTRIQLVDGGVHDNQGVEGLLEMNCDGLIISDASGQMEDDPEPSILAPFVLLRSNDISMKMQRELLLNNVFQDKRFTTVFLHMRKELANPILPFRQKDDTVTEIQKKQPGTDRTGYGVNRQVQNLLSRIRTDLDSFTDIEANALMMDGYAMARTYLRAPGGGSKHVSDWKFLEINSYLSSPNKKFLRHLRVGAKTVFKPFFLNPLATSIVGILFLAGIALIAIETGSIGKMIEFWNAPLVNYTKGKVIVSIMEILIPVLLPAVLGAAVPAIRYIIQILKLPLKWYELSVRFIFKALLPAVVGFFVSRCWILTFDKIFLHSGRLRKLGPTGINKNGVPTN